MAEEELTNKERRKARKAERAQAREAEAPKKKRRADSDIPDADAAEEPEAVDPPASAPADLPEAGDEDPPLSHKERRKRRRMEKAEARASEAFDTQSPPSVPRAPARPKRSPYSVWIGNLAFSTTQEQLTEWLRDHNIEGISRVHMPQGVRKFEYNKGFAYVDLPSQAQVEACMALSEEQLAGRRLLIKSGSDFTGRPGLDVTALTGVHGASSGRTGLTKTAQKILQAQRNPAGPTLFMGNLSFETTEEAIRELFDGSAQRRYLQEHENDPEDQRDADPPGAGIKKIRMGTFEDTGKCKGFAFVDFVSTTDATKALLEPRNGRLLGRTLQLEYAGVDAIRRGASRNLLPDYVPTPRRRRAPKASEDAGVGAPAPADARGDASTDATSDAPDAGPGARGPPEPRRVPGKPRGPSRMRPGAANAAAPRQHYAIQPAAGKRITFE
ncbi:Nucleolar protein 13 [Malassezia brasiliensis]|uniref:Nucleolar protein 13 n=1 Tax=Malassezia brasiliensis TaxID=1821822 RepID=A0AAF0IQG8_9BASI|nr:Nucleolar protein 13 [Malassezia brasiliensis]